MTARMVTLDCTDPDDLASWWAAALDGTVQSVYPGWFAIVSAQPISLGFQKVPEDKVGKNRVHVDFSVDDREAAVQRLVESGATVVDEHSVPTGFTWTVTRAPSFLRMPGGCSLKGLGGSRGDSLWWSPFEGLHDTAAPGSAEVADRLQEDAPQSAS